MLTQVKYLLCNDADGKFTLPSQLLATTPGSDPTDPNQLNNIGASFTFVYIETLATDLRYQKLMALISS